MAKRFLVTGGAGFVGSHLVAVLAAQGAEIVVVDDLRAGHRQAVPPGVRLIVGNIADRPLMDAVLGDGPWEAVLHFAALSQVGQSMRQPLLYLRENVGGGLELIDACLAHGIQRFVLSSTAAIFGHAGDGPIGETAPINPLSPYGESKLMLEHALQWADRQHGMRFACLRYFNAAGAAPEGHIGEDHDPETHLIPLVIDAALGRAPGLTVFGEDYATPDGTCIRDYVHVSDLAEAHLCALRQLETGSVTYNVGNGRGYSVREVIAAVTAVCGRTVPFSVGPRRPGDPPVLIAGSERLRATGWTPRFGDLETIVRTAYAWRLAHPGGYDGGRATTPAERLELVKQAS